MIKRGSSRVNKSMTNSPISEEILSIVKGINCGANVTDNNSCVDSINFENDPDGTYVLRNPIVKQTSAGIASYFLNRTGYEIRFSKVPGSSAIHMYIIDQNGDTYPLHIKWTKTDFSTGEYVLGVSEDINNLFNINNMDVLEAGDITILTKCLVNLTDSRIPGIYDPEIMTGTFVARYLSIYQDPDSSDWILKIVSPEPNTIPDTAIDWAYDVNLLLDNIYSLTDLYNYGATSVKGIVAYKRKNLSDIVNPTGLPDSSTLAIKSYVAAEDTVFDFFITGQTNKDAYICLRARHHIMTSEAYQRIKYMHDKELENANSIYFKPGSLGPHQIILQFYDTHCKYVEPSSPYGSRSKINISADNNPNAHYFELKITVEIPDYCPAGYIIFKQKVSNLTSSDTTSGQVTRFDWSTSENSWVSSASSQYDVYKDWVNFKFFRCLWKYDNGYLLYVVDKTVSFEDIPQNDYLNLGPIRYDYDSFGYEFWTSKLGSFLDDSPYFCQVWKEFMDTEITNKGIRFFLSKPYVYRNNEKDIIFPYYDIYYGTPNTTITPIRKYISDSNTLAIMKTDFESYMYVGFSKYIELRPILSDSDCYFHEIYTNELKVKELTSKVTDAKYEIISTIDSKYNEPIVLKALLTTLPKKDVCNYWGTWEESNDDGISWKTCPDFLAKYSKTIKYLPQVDYYGKETLEDSYGYVKYLPFMQVNPESEDDLAYDRPDVLYVQKVDTAKQYRFRIVYYPVDGSSDHSFVYNKNDMALQVWLTPPTKTISGTTSYDSQTQASAIKMKDSFIVSSYLGENFSYSKDYGVPLKLLADTKIYVGFFHEFDQNTSATAAADWVAELTLYYGKKDTLTDEVLFEECNDSTKFSNVVKITDRKYLFFAEVLLNINAVLTDKKVPITRSETYRFLVKDVNNLTYADCKVNNMFYEMGYLDNNCTNIDSYYSRFWENSRLTTIHPIECDIKSETTSLTNVNIGYDGWPSFGVTESTYATYSLEELFKFWGTGPGGVDEDAAVSGAGPYFSNIEDPSVFSFNQTFVLYNKNNIDMPVYIDVDRPYNSYDESYGCRNISGEMTLSANGIVHTTRFEYRGTSDAGGYAVLTSNPKIITKIPANSSITVKLTYNVKFNAYSHSGAAPHIVSLKRMLQCFLLIPCFSTPSTEETYVLNAYKNNSDVAYNIKFGNSNSNTALWAFNSDVTSWDIKYIPGTHTRWMSDKALYGPTYAVNAYVLSMATNFKLQLGTETKTLQNKSIPIIKDGKTFFHYNRIFTYGVKGYESQIFVSAADSYITYMSNVIDIPTGNKVTKLIGWRNYILAFTDTDINLISYDSDLGTFSVKIINNTIGVSEGDADTVCSVLNMIIFKSQDTVYRLMPNLYSDADNILNTVIISSPVEDQLKYNISFIYKNFAIATEKDYWLFTKHATSEKSYVFKYDLTSKIWNVFTYNILFGRAEYTRLNEFYVYSARDIIQRYDYIRYYFHYGLRELLSKCMIVGFAAYDSGNNFVGVVGADDDQLGIIKLTTDFETNRSDIYKYLPYGDYYNKTPKELSTWLNDDPKVTFSDVFEFPFSIDFGQKSSNYALDKQYLETKLLFGSLSERDLFPVTVDIAADGFSKPLHWDVNTDSALQKTTFNIINGGFVGHFGTVGTTFGTPDTTNIGVLRQLIVKYSGRGKTSRVVISGKSKYKFKFYSLINRFRLPAKKQ